MYKVEILKDDCEWNKFVHINRTSVLYHLVEWRDILIETFGHKSFYIVIKEDTIVKGLLPLILIKSRIFGRILVSMPFLNYGGACAENEQVYLLLLQEAVAIAKRENVAYIELRQRDELSLNIPVKKSKVCMILDLKPEPEDIWKTLDSKVRNQIRKAQKSDLRVEIGLSDQIANFYNVFCLNMRDLGTPVYSKVFFENIIKRLTDRTRIFSVIKNDLILASGFTIGYKDSLEIPWASSNRIYNKLCPNTLLYWEIIKYACERGYKKFDLGRCSLNSGTFNFKKQWGAKPKQLYWYYWLPENNQLPELNPANPKYKLLIAAWQRLPLVIANFIGPYISKSIP